MSKAFICLIFWYCLITNCSTYFDTKPNGHCFCKLDGRIDDCTCTVDTVDYFNNVKIFPLMTRLLENDYFRFYRVNLKQDCPFWTDDSRCAMRYCHIETCDDHDIPIGLKGSFHELNSFRESAVKKYTSKKADCKKDHNEELSYLNTTISADSYKEFELWREHDDAQDNFCVEQDDTGGGAEYVDLLLNPERYTGYKGESAHRIWRSIYKENCFKLAQNDDISYVRSSNLDGLCLEKRVFYRVVSGLHSSINIHLCSNYLLTETQKNLNFITPSQLWGQNLQEFRNRFDPTITNEEGPQWLRNLYFVYLLELRALEKASAYFSHLEFYSGNDSNDENVRKAIADLVFIIRNFPNHFNESKMFNGGYKTKKLKEEFRQHFRNISRIMHCVGCDKCKLWGKLQIQGLGTALKILFSGKFDNENQNLETIKHQFRLKRGEIVSLFNGFGRLSTSIYELEQFRQLFR